MKSKLSITLDEETITEIEEQLHSGKFRYRKYRQIKFDCNNGGDIFGRQESPVIIMRPSSELIEQGWRFLTNKSHLIEFAVRKLLEVENGRQ